MKYNRHSIRLTNYDYSKNGLYYITICALGKQILFGEINDGEMKLNEFGNIAQNQLNILTENYKDIIIENFIIMPNHIHFILIKNDDKVKLGNIIAYYKYETSKKINELNKEEFIKVWQRNYFERIIRNEQELNNIIEYIYNNPINWENKY